MSTADEHTLAHPNNLHDCKKEAAHLDKFN